jgi:hypothetical protein
VSRIAKHLLPDSANTNKLGRLEIGGCDLIDVAERFGTPTFVYDEDKLSLYFFAVAIILFMSFSWVDALPPGLKFLVNILNPWF